MITSTHLPPPHPLPPSLHPPVLPVLYCLLYPGDTGDVTVIRSPRADSRSRFNPCRSPMLSTPLTVPSYSTSTTGVVSSSWPQAVSTTVSRLATHTCDVIAGSNSLSANVTPVQRYKIHECW